MDLLYLPFHPATIVLQSNVFRPVNKVKSWKCQSLSGCSTYHLATAFLRPRVCLPTACIFSYTFSHTLGTPKNSVGRTSRSVSTSEPYSSATNYEIVKKRTKKRSTSFNRRYLESVRLGKVHRAAGGQWHVNVGELRTAINVIYCAPFSLLF